MAWRIADYVERGEIDNREKGRVHGQLWLCGIDAPVQLELTGNPYRDLAGRILRFTNPKPKQMPPHLADFAPEQTGTVGDITAARKVKVPDVPLDEIHKYYKTGLKLPYHWGNSLYLEWHSVRNGRVVIEATEYDLQIDDAEPTYSMSAEDEVEQQKANARAMTNFMDIMLEAANAQAEAEDSDFDDSPQSEAEAEADAEAARMDKLLDRITARLDREEHAADPEAFERIMEEERQRLRRERGEPEPEPLSPEEEAERAEWLAEAEEAALESASEADPFQEHPLVEHCHELGSRLHKDIKANDWLPEGAPEEHPLAELTHGVWSAGAKLAGALNGGPADWPPDPLFAGNCLVRLKKAYDYLNDALAALDAAEAEKLAAPTWLQNIRPELTGLRDATRELIEEVRAILNRNEGD